MFSTPMSVLPKRRRETHLQNGRDDLQRAILSSQNLLRDNLEQLNVDGRARSRLPKFLQISHQYIAPFGSKETDLKELRDLSPVLDGAKRLDLERKDGVGELDEPIQLWMRESGVLELSLESCDLGHEGIERDHLSASALLRARICDTPCSFRP